MDYTQILQHLIINSLWYLIPLAILAVILKSSWYKGKTGEAVVNLSAKLFLDKTRYHLIRKFTLPTGDGTSRINHIVVSRNGLFVVETKNTKVWIFGNAKQRQWTTKIYRRSQKFQNPLHQNYKHVKMLQSQLDLSDEQMFLVLVFLGDSTFTTPRPENVAHGGGHIRFVKAQTEASLSDAEVHKVIVAIESERLKATFRNHWKHLAHVKEVVAKKPSEARYLKCQDEMMRRKVKRGESVWREFLGFNALVWSPLFYDRNNKRSMTSLFLRND